MFVPFCLSFGIFVFVFKVPNKFAMSTLNVSNGKMAPTIDSTIRKHHQWLIFTHLFINKCINFFQWQSIHIWRKWLEFTRQHCTIFNLDFCTRMKSILSYQLYMPRLMLILTLFSIRNNLLFDYKERKKRKNKRR